MKKALKELIPYVVIVVVVVLIRTFIITPVRVDGDSMIPTLKNNDILLLSKVSRNFERFDIVVVNKKSTKLVKRIIGLPGETIKYDNNRLYINDKLIEDVVDIEIIDFEQVIPEGYYFVMGDNRGNSLDSRDARVGLIKEKEITGTTVFRLFPFNKIGKID